MDVWCSSSSSSIGIPARHKETEHLPGEEIIFLDLSTMASTEASAISGCWRRAIRLEEGGFTGGGWGFCPEGAVRGRLCTAWERLPSARLQRRGMANSIIYEKTSKCQRNQRGGELEAPRGKKAELLFMTGPRWSIISCSVSHQHEPRARLRKACGRQRPTAVELQLVVEVIQLLLDVRGARTVITGAERQQHVDLQFDKQRNSASKLSRLCSPILLWSGVFNQPPKQKRL